MVYEELQCNAAAAKSSRTSVNAVTDYIPIEGSKKLDDQDKGAPQNTNQRQWRNLEDYTFDINHTEWWFELLIREGKMTPRDPLEPLKPGNGKKDKLVDTTSNQTILLADAKKSWRQFKTWWTRGRLSRRRIMMPPSPLLLLSLMLPTMVYPLEMIIT